MHTVTTLNTDIIVYNYYNYIMYIMHTCIYVHNDVISRVNFKKGFCIILLNLCIILLLKFWGRTLTLRVILTAVFPQSGKK